MRTNRRVPRSEPLLRVRRPALWFDLPVALLLIVCWMTIPVAAAHIATGLALIAAVAIHLLTRRAVFPRGSARRRIAVAVLLAATAATLLTGVLRWIGLPREVVFHAVPGYLLVAAVLWHAARRRRAVVARLRPRRPR
ncbi:hypothetical protein ACFPM7_23790 [Actinokineospora guangxiensis]|uniref:Uncharacterized protein n=1 Tax=Actinokineospora guangxiensis TaxID=1490288 RepID=A0ABW0EUJ1_9PSEU